MKKHLAFSIWLLARKGSQQFRRADACSHSNAEGPNANCQMLSAGKFRRVPRSQPEQGYILLTLMFLAALVILSLAALAPQIAQQVKRDQEEELIHRGVQYARAIQHFYKKTGRYPVSLSELDNLNNVRFLRKHYKDPITGKDFKLLHFGEVQVMMGAGIPGAVSAANMANVRGAVNPQAAMLSQGGFSQVTGLTQSQMNQAAQAQVMFQNMPSTTNPPGLNSSDTSIGSQMQGSAGGVAAGDSGTDAGSSSNAPEGSNATSAFGTPGQNIGGGPIVGVASTSKKKSIREFNKKNHYKDWQFIYDPSSDRGGLLNTPAQPNLSVSSSQGNAPAGPGQGQGWAPQSQQPNSFGQQGMPMPNQPPDQMQQQEP